MPLLVVTIIVSPAHRGKCYVLGFLENFMPTLLRKIDHKTNWAKDGDFSKYIPQGSAPADALQDVSTDENALSVWEAGEDSASFDRVVAAIASNREYLQKIDFLVFDSTLVKDLGLKMERKPGETLDEYANASWHFDLIHLSVSDLSCLANAMFANANIKRLYEKDLVRLLRTSIGNGHIDGDKLKPSVKSKVLSQK